MKSSRLKISMFLALSGRDKLLFLEAFLLHLWVGLLLKVMPFRWITRLFGSRQTSVSSLQSVVGNLRLRRRRSHAHTVSCRKLNPAHEVSGRKSEDIIMIKRAIERANLLSPWRNRCLVSSITARCMLRRRNIDSQLSLGVAKDSSGKLIAHAWINAGDFALIEKTTVFRELYYF